MRVRGVRSGMVGSEELGGKGTVVELRTRGRGRRRKRTDSEMRGSWLGPERRCRRRGFDCSAIVRG